jgi:hypothetical protein
MGQPSFDVAGAVVFDLPRGAVRAGGTQIVCVPIEALAALADDPRVAERVGRAMGQAVGKRILTRVGSSNAVREASIERVVTELGAEFALAGYGSLSLQRWGRAMVLVVTDGALPDPLLHAVFAASLEVSTGQKVACTTLTREGTKVSVLVSSERAVKQAGDWLGSGIAWGEVLTRLQAASGVS